MFNFNLFVKSRDGVIFSGPVLSLTSYNKKGRFDVLPGHANFISLIKEKLVIRDAKGVIKELPLTNGLMRFKKNSAEVYLGIEALSSLDKIADRPD